MPLISILMPAHNAAKFISKALASCLEQTVQDLEILVVDDASSDETYQQVLAMSKADKRLRLLRNTKRLGVAASLNTALQQAQGEFVARLDADDAMVAERLATQLKFMQAHPEIAVLGSNANIIDETDRVIGELVHPKQDWREIAAQIYFESPFIHPSVFMRKEALLSVGGYAEQIAAEDYDLWFRLFNASYKFANLAAKLTNYRAHPRQLTRELGTISLSKCQIQKKYWWKNLHFPMPLSHLQILDDYFYQQVSQVEVTKNFLIMAELVLLEVFFVSHLPGWIALQTFHNYVLLLCKRLMKKIFVKLRIMQ